MTPIKFLVLLSLMVFTCGVHAKSILQNDTSVFNKRHLSEIVTTTQKSMDTGFCILFHKAKQVDRVMGWDYAEKCVINIIMKEDSNVVAANRKAIQGLKPVVKIDNVTYYAHKETNIKDPEPPDWKGMYSAVKAKYGSFYAGRITKWVGMDYYKTRQEWPEYAHRLVAYYNAFPLELGFSDRNDYAWYVFQYSREKKELKIALKWIKAIVVDSSKSDWQTTDTYANLLYKLDHKSEALAQENIALSLAPEENKNEILAVLDKMRKGDKTWP